MTLQPTTHIKAHSVAQLYDAVLETLAVPNLYHLAPRLGVNHRTLYRTRRNNHLTPRIETGLWVLGIVPELIPEEEEDEAMTVETESGTTRIHYRGAPEPGSTGFAKSRNGSITMTSDCAEAWQEWRKQAHLHHHPGEYEVLAWVAAWDAATEQKEETKRTLDEKLDAAQAEAAHLEAVIHEAWVALSSDADGEPIPLSMPLPQAISHCLNQRHATAPEELDDERVLDWLVARLAQVEALEKRAAAYDRIQAILSNQEG